MFSKIRYFHSLISWKGSRSVSIIFLSWGLKKSSGVGDDFIVDKILIDAMSMQYLEDATIDYISDRLKGSQFIFINPNAKSTCGCGSSFSVWNQS